MATYRAFLVLFVAVGVGAIPFTRRTDSTKCARTCSGQTKKFNYQPGDAYRYMYEIDTETTWPSVTEESTKLRIQATAEIEAGENCEFVLQLRDVLVFHSQPGRDNLLLAERVDEFKSTLETSPLRFAFDDGVVATVCPDSTEGDFALNFKRGLLSAFQNSMKDFSKETQSVLEIDVNGECYADYKVSTGWGAWNSMTTVSRTKDMYACRDRAGFHGVAQYVPYEVPADIQTIPILKSEHECTQDVSADKVLQSAQCIEKHRFVPFKHQESGATTSVTQKLTFQQKSSGSGNFPPVYRTETLLYTHGTRKLESTRENAQMVLKELCEQTKNDIRPETPRLVSELTEVVKGLDFSSLDGLYSLLKSGNICPGNPRALRFFVNSLPNARTLASVQMVASLVGNQEVDAPVAKLLIQSLSLIKDATEQHVAAALPLLRGEYSEFAKLPVSTLTSSYCRNTAACQANTYVEQVREKLAESIGDSCSITEDTLVPVLSSLHALGNLRRLSSQDDLAKCLSSSSTPLEVRVAAADAYRRAACPETDDHDKALWTAIRDPADDIEVRITSYLSVMRCPKESTLKAVAAFMRGAGEDDQLAYFIYSHLKQILQSSDPFKQDLARAIRHLDIPNFELKSMTQSRNRELSFLINKMNLGAVVDANLIMSPAAPVPRALKLNITLDLFGNAINVLEVGARVEGLEKAIPKFLDTGRLEAPEGSRASSYIRVFGNELMYRHKLDSESFFGEKLPTREDIMKAFAKQNEVGYTISRNVMDLTVVYPTTAGLPLEVRANSTATLDFKADGKIDMTRLYRRSDAEINGGLQFGAAMEITGNMAVDALVTKLGVRTRQVAHSSTQIRAKIDRKEGPVFSVEVQAPPDGMEIFQAKSEFFLNYNGVEKKQDVAKDLKTLKLCTSEMGAKITGAQLCGELGHTHFSVKLNKRDTQTSYKYLFKVLDVPKGLTLQYELDTPGSQTDRRIFLEVKFNSEKEKTMDINLASPWRQFKYHGEFSEVKGKRTIRFVSDALIDEKYKYEAISEMKEERGGTGVFIYKPTVDVKLNGEEFKAVTGEIKVTDGRKFEWDIDVQRANEKAKNVVGAFISNKAERRLRWTVTEDEDRKYMVDVGIKCDITKGKKGAESRECVPGVVIKSPEKNYLLVVAETKYQYNKRPDILYKGKLEATLLDKKPASIDWLTALKKDKKGKYIRDINLKVKSALMNGNLDVHAYRAKAGHGSGRVKGYYNIPGVDKNSFLYTAKLNDMSKNNLKKYSWKSSFDNKKYPQYNMAMDANLDHKSRKQTAMDFEVKYGDNHNLVKKRVNFSHLVKQEKKGKTHIDYHVDTSLKVPEKDVDFHIQGHHHRTSSAWETKTNLKLYPVVEHNVEVAWEAHDKSKKLTHRDLKAHFQYGTHKHEISSKLDQKSKHHYVHTFNAQRPTGEKYIVSSDFKNAGQYKKEFSTLINFHGYKHVKLGAKLAYEPTNRFLSARCQYGTKSYGMLAHRKFAPGEFAKFRFEVERPERKVEVNSHFKMSDEKFNRGFMINWDARKKARANSEIKFDIDVKRKMKDDYKSITGQMSLKTPFEPMTDSSLVVKATNDPKEYNVHTKVTWQGKHGKIAVNGIVKKPLKPTNVKINLNAHTNFKTYKNMELDIDHSIDESLLTTLRTKLDTKGSLLKIVAEDKGTEEKRNLHALVDLKTPLKELKHIHFTADHTSDGNHYEAKARLNYNTKIYNWNSEMDITEEDDTVKRTGKIYFTKPEDSMVADWSHQYNPTEKKGSAELHTKWDKSGDTLDIEVEGRREDKDGERTINLKWNVKDPENNVHDVSLRHIYSDNKIDLKGQVFRNTMPYREYEIFWERSEEERSAKIYINPSPDREPINGEVTLNYGSYPKTYTAWLQWNPDSRIDLDGSVSAPTWTDIEFSTKMMTPFESISDVNAYGSHKFEDDEYVSHANIIYGVGKTIDIERRARFDDEMKMMRMKVQTPFERLTDLDFGYQLDHREDGFDFNADHEALPKFPKRELSFSVTRDEDNVPFKRPKEVELSIKTPIPEFEDIGFKISREFRPKGVDFLAQFRGKNDRRGEIKLNTDFDDKIDIEFVVKTPFEKFEHNNFILRKSGEMTTNSFERSSELNIGPRKFRSHMLRDLKEKSGKIELAFALSAPIIDDVALEYGRDYSVDFEGLSESKTTWKSHRGEKQIDGQLDFKVDRSDGVTMEAVVALKTTFDKLKTLDITMNRVISDNEASGSTSLVATGELAKKVDASFSRTGDMNDLTANFNVMYNDEPAIDVSLEREKLEDEFHSKLTTSGAWIPKIEAKTDYSGPDKDFRSYVKMTTTDKYAVDQEVTITRRKNKIDVDGHLDFKFNEKDYNLALVLKKRGNPRKLKVDITRTFNGDVFTADIDFSRSKDWKKLGLTVETTSPVEDHEFKKIEYSHDLETDVRYQRSFRAQRGGDEEFSIELVREETPRKSLNIQVKTPMEGYKDLLWSVAYGEDSVDIAIARDDKKFTLSGTRQVSEKSYNLKYTITTPLFRAKKVEIEYNGEPFDRKLDYTITREDDLKSAVNILAKYDDMFNFNFNFDLNKDLDESERAYEPFKFVATRQESTTEGKKAHLQVDKYLMVDGHYSKIEDIWTSAVVHNFDLEVNSMLLKKRFDFTKWHGTSQATVSETRKANTITIYTDDKPRVDVDLTLMKGDDRKFTAVFRHPRPMEYSVTRTFKYIGPKGFETTVEADLNWDKNDPEAVAKVNGMLKFEPNMFGLSVKEKLTIVKPKRTVGYDSSVEIGFDNLNVDVKYFWDKDNDKKVFYKFDFNRYPYRKDEATEVEIRLGLPFRTVGYSSYSGDDRVNRKTTAAFMWDMERDMDKKIAFDAVMSRHEGTKRATVSLKLPAEVAVNTVWTAFDGSTLFDCKTDITYSRDARKTFTVFSKIKDIQTKGFFFQPVGGFNYSVELGVRHPETRTDLSVDYKIGMSSDLYTSALDISYMTSRRKVVNMALSSEIDRIKKQINLRAVGPKHQTTFSSKMISESPLHVRMSRTWDEEEEFFSEFIIDKENKEVDIAFGKPELHMSYKAFFPNATAFKATLTRNQGLQKFEEGQINLLLTSPRVILSSYDWRPGMFDEARNYMMKTMKERRQLIKKSVRKMANGLENELTKKHEGIMKSVMEDMQPLVNTITEDMDTFSEEVATVRATLKELKNHEEPFLAAVGRMSEFMSEKISARLEMIQERVQARRAWIMDKVSKRMEMIKNSEFRKKVRSFVRYVIDRRLKALDKVVSGIGAIFDKIEERVAMLREKRPLMRLYDHVYNHERFQPIRERLEKVRNADFETIFEERRAMMRERVQERIAFLKERFTPLWELLPEQMRERVTMVFDQVKSVREFWINEELAAFRVRSLLELLREEVKDEMTQYTYSLQMLGGRNQFSVFDLENGKIRGRIDLPVPLQRLDQIMEIDTYQLRMKMLTTRLRMMFLRNRPEVADVVNAGWNSNETFDNNQVLS